MPRGSKSGHERSNDDCANAETQLRRRSANIAISNRTGKNFCSDMRFQNLEIKFQEILSEYALNLFGLSHPFGAGRDYVIGGTGNEETKFREPFVCLELGRNHPSQR
ncbi:hypothetical protein CIHG_00401 [Coccidioides immitis H538.4]|uniref:Uncharacterized protein n=3 Tax=Coccidioides immitis TaxID=5501 RepID=A0A0J8QHP5_COCIT|nr:hypothetical protein CIRG_07218 [Coccidioides immitis RMSCC 2394]KMU72011.1 hypothetical protein CISG_00321 [Coccidioides immitis RMSCC 3703]KMU82621.1 hypothetical protein CIHG_00401 [Coccidioides immitis H538.4]